MDVVRMLLERDDVNPDSVGPDGRTPLMYAAIYGREEIVRILLETRVIDPLRVGASGRMAVDHVGYGHCGIAKFLIVWLVERMTNISNDGVQDSL